MTSLRASLAATVFRPAGLLQRAGVLTRAALASLALLLASGVPGWALDPHKALTQYSRTVWTEAQGLPQDTIRAITQTADGNLWLGTDEGLARFDGYDFVTFTKDTRDPILKGAGQLPSNSITALAAAKDGSLWIGTQNGLTRYQNRRFTTFTTKEGLPDNSIVSLYEDHSGSVWIAAGIYLSRFENGKFVNYAAADVSPIEAVRAVFEDSHHTIWVGGAGGVIRLVNGSFAPILGDELRGHIVNAMTEDRNGGLWIAGTQGLVLRRPDGRLQRFSSRDGLPDDLVRAMWLDRAGTIWAGTNRGLSRVEERPGATPRIDAVQERDWVRCLFEDREGNLWAGTNGGLSRYRDDRFVTYGREEGLPSDEPIAVHQDRKGQLWVGFHDGGLTRFTEGGYRTYTTADGLLSNEIFSIRESANGDLLIGTRGGLSRMHGGQFINRVIPDPLKRDLVFDVLEDHRGRLLVATPGGLDELTDHDIKVLVPGSPLLNGDIVVLSESHDGTLWAGTYGDGLWRIVDGTAKLLTTADGLGSNQIRSLTEDKDGTLWIATFGGGLTSLRDGVFARYTADDGLLSDNISHVEDDGLGYLWLSTTRGICKVSKLQLADRAANRTHVLTPENFGVGNGLRSSQCAPAYPAGSGGARTADGRLWFPTSHGLAVIDPRTPPLRTDAPVVQMMGVSVDGHPVDFSRTVEFQPDTQQVQFHYTGIHLSAPERVQYSYQLKGLDHDWISAGNRRSINYSNLPHGPYRFAVRATLNGASSEASFGFEVLPHIYERTWFLWLCAACVLASVYGFYQLRLRQIHGRFTLVLEERGRLAREIHDTLAQGFVGIASQLDAVILRMNGDSSDTRKHLELARRMAQHSLTEARRSMMNLRTSALDDVDLPAALTRSARQWVAGSPVRVQVDVFGSHRKLPEETEQDLLRIAQEAVANALKHARAKQIWVELNVEARRLLLRIKDDGRGFEPAMAFSAIGGHFGILGMRERAERMGGELELSSQPGTGTQVEVRVPIS